MTKIINILLCGILIYGAGCTNPPEEPALEETEPGQVRISRIQFETNDMQLGQVQPAEFSRTVRSSGVIDVPPQQRARVSAIMGGFIKQVPLLIGNEVKKGDLIAVLENPEYVNLQQEYLEVAEQINYLRADYERQQKLFEEKITSQKNFLKAESDYKRARASLAGMKANLELLGIPVQRVESGQFTTQVRLYAPVSGSVTKLSVSLGSYVNPSDLIMEIVDPSHKHLELIVYEKDVLFLEPGQRIRFRVPEASSQFFEAGIQLIGQSVNEESRTINIHGHINEEDEGRFKVGMFVEAHIILDEMTLPSVPESAVIGSGDSRQIMVLEEENEDYLTFRRVPVEAGDLQDGRVPLLQFEDSTRTILLRGAFGSGGQED